MKSLFGDEKIYDFVESSFSKRGPDLSLLLPLSAAGVHDSFWYSLPLTHGTLVLGVVGPFVWLMLYTNLVRIRLPQLLLPISSKGILRGRESKDEI